MIRSRERSRDGGLSAAGGGVSFDFATDAPDVVVRLSTADAGNITTTFSEDFATADVDTATNIVNISNANFNRINDRNFCPVYFSTTGTLPSPLQEDTPYYIENVTGGIKVYPLATDADYTNVPSYLQGETVPPATFISYQINEIDFTDQGTGTHTLYTKTLMTKWVDLEGNNDTQTSTQLNAMFEVETDAHGTYAISQGGIMRQRERSSHDLYGMAKDSATTQQFADLFSGKRFVWGVCVSRPFAQQKFMPERVTLDVGAVNTTTDEFESDGNHGFTTGMYVVTEAYPGVTLPTGLPSSAYVRDTGSDTFTLHPTEADATNDTNKINITADSDGLYCITAPATVGDGSRNQYLFTLDDVDGGQHLINPGLAQFSTLRDQDDFNTNGEIISLWDNNDDFNDIDVVPLDIWIPPGATAPTRADTGQPLASGRYYATKRPASSTRQRLYDTYADAEASVGVATASTNAITYSDTGDGQFAFAIEDAFTQYGSFTLPSQNFDRPQVATGKAAVFVFIRDLNPTSGSFPTVTYGRNDIDNLGTGTYNDTKGDLTDTPAPMGYRLFTADEPHVTGKSHMYDYVIGTSDNDPTTQIQAIVDHFISERNISQTSGFEAPANTTTPSISGTEQEGETLTGDVGEWTGQPDTSLTYQWKRSGVDISGATSLTYVVQSADVGETLTFEVTGKNQEGSATAESVATGTIIAGSSFTNPTDVSAVGFWGDASAQADGAVATFANQISGGTNAIQGTGSAQPTASSGVITYNGADYLNLAEDFSAGTEFSGGVIITPVIDGTRQYIVDQSNGSVGMILRIQLTTNRVALYVFTDAGTIFVEAPTALSDGVSYAVGWRVKSGSIELYVDGAANSDTDTTTFTSINDASGGDIVIGAESDGSVVDAYDDGTMEDIWLSFDTYVEDDDFNNLMNYIADQSSSASWTDTT